MRLELAIVIGRVPEGCSVVPLGGSETLHAAFAEPFRPRAASLPERALVALDTGPTPPAVVWRWFPARVLTVTDDHVTLDEPFHGVIGARLHAHLPRRPGPGETVYASIGLTDDWRVDATEADPGTAASALPEVDGLYARLYGAAGADTAPAAG